jgi:hypothetical protein
MKTPLVYGQRRRRPSRGFTNDVMDPSCGNHRACPWCTSSRLRYQRLAAVIEAQERELADLPPLAPVEAVAAVGATGATEAAGRVNRSYVMAESGRA